MNLNNLLVKQSLEDKLLSGYAYRLTPKEGMNNLNTGIGGAKMLIENFRKSGMSDDFIQDAIQVCTDTHGWISLADLTVKKK